MKSAQYKKPHIPLILRLVTGLVSLIILLFLVDFAYTKFTPIPKIDYGVTFSIVQAKNLNLPPDILYWEILDDLKVKRMRLPLYWDTIEKNRGRYDFSLYDKLLDQAAAREVQVILVIGYKVPRWPECFTPDWANSLSNPEFEDKILQLDKASIDHFKSRPEIIAWQVENEPFLDFGVCRRFDSNFLRQEVALVHQKDSRPVLVTDAGERGWWTAPMQIGDIFGTTLYRTVWDKTLGDMTYPIPAIAYPLHYQLIHTLLAPQNKGIIISELQAEGWPAPDKDILAAPAQEQAKKFPLAEFKDIISYASNTHIKEQYLWGVEWWYFMKSHGHPEYWEYAKDLLSR